VKFILVKSVPQNDGECTRKIAFNFLLNDHPAFGTPPQKNRRGKSVTKTIFSFFKKEVEEMPTRCR